MSRVTSIAYFARDASALPSGNFEKCEIPELFDSLSFGWNNYQKAEPTGFVSWIDDIALCKERIGERGLPPPPKKAKK